MSKKPELLDETLRRRRQLETKISNIDSMLLGLELSGFGVFSKKKYIHVFDSKGNNRGKLSSDEDRLLMSFLQERRNEAERKLEEIDSKLEKGL